MKKPRKPIRAKIAARIKKIRNTPRHGDGGFLSASIKAHVDRKKK